MTKKIVGQNQSYPGVATFGVRRYICDFRFHFFQNLINWKFLVAVRYKKSGDNRLKNLVHISSVKTADIL